MSLTNQCKLCQDNESRYVCPRCNIPYCSLTCYQSEAHAQCSESFYKDCVVDQIKNDELDPDSQKRMMDILQRVQHIDDEVNIGEEDELDSDDESDCEELAARLAGVDLDDADQVWQHLTSEEKRQFEELLRSGDVTKVIPSWQPWWYNRVNDPLVQDLESRSQPDVNTSESTTTFPAVLERIPPFSTISKVTPSPCVRWNMVNVLAAYALITRVYNGDHHGSSLEAVDMLLSLSENLSTNQLYDSPDLAVAAVLLTACKADSMTGPVDEGVLKDDVKKLVEGPSQTKQSHYVLAALSDLHALLTSAKKKAKANKNVKASGEFSKRFIDSSTTACHSTSVNSLNICLRKIEYYLSWTKEFF